jgi:hypothetical protein
VYGALAAIAVVSALAQRLAHRLDVPETLRAVLAGSTGIAMLGMCIVGYVWLMRAWEGVRAPTDMSGNEAAMRLVIPVYGLFWMFTVHTRLCAMLDARLAARGPSRAPRALAILAAAATLVWCSSGEVLPGCHGRGPLDRRCRVVRAHEGGGSIARGVALTRGSASRTSLGCLSYSFSAHRLFGGPLR